MDLDEFDITQCRVCGKLFRTEPHKGLCRECSLELAEAGEIIEAVNDVHEPLHSGNTHRGPLDDIDPQDTWDTFELPFLGDSLVCVRCNSRPTIQDSDFCLRCQVALSSDLGDAATELFSGSGFLDKGKRATSGLSSAVQEKRDRAPTRRMNPVTVGRLKT